MPLPRNVVTTVVTGTKERGTYVSLAVIFPLIEACITTSNSCLYRKSRQWLTRNSQTYRNKTSIYVINLVNKNVKNQQVPTAPGAKRGKTVMSSAGKHASDVKRGKNMPVMSNVGKHAGDAKRGKICHWRQLQENIHAIIADQVWKELECK